MQQQILEAYSTIFAALECRTLKEGEFQGELRLTDELKKNLEILEEAGLTSGAYDFTKNGEPASSANLSQLKPGHYADNIRFNVDLSAQEIKPDYAICSNWNDILANELRVKSPVRYIFFTDTALLFSPSNNDEKYRNYLSIHKVYKLIAELAELTEGGDKTIFYDRPLSFQFVLREIDLEHSIDLQAIDKLLSKDLHKEAITCLICKELVSFLKDKAPKQRFSYLIQHMSSLISNVLLSYQGYVENYTFDKARKEYMEKRTEYVSKIHEIFDNIATKLLSLPAGIWFATTQIKLVETAGLNTMTYAKNVSVVITVLVLAALLIFNLVGQFSTLKILNKEYSGVFDELAKAYEDEASDIRNAKGNIESAQFQVEIKLYLSIIAALVLLGLTIWLFCKAYN
ncbi:MULTISPECIES: hypothetical protein [unclassified Pseudoalteromonas]|uniref:hypothetical protein n=1 Tax=unclassified Pseudoalteromonas TaxID=194690 RepID=UPI000C086325|nr:MULTISPECIES: hypothetical protein [unclassified Pseudoalteromonas]MDP2633682.1 hypothetical protein [Pseudoalteromonas sp. 1_MG-2023]PHN89665.1 hypothetical protein CSC79_11745 [Pseudoalteromonas sp. 3D05]